MKLFQKTVSQPTNVVRLGPVSAEIRRLPTDESLSLLFEYAPVISHLTGHAESLAQRGLLPMVLGLVGAATNRDPMWLVEFCTPEQILHALFVADRVNGWTEAFAHVKGLGWADDTPA